MPFSRVHVFSALRVLPRELLLALCPEAHSSGLSPLSVEALTPRKRQRVGPVTFGAIESRGKALQIIGLIFN